MSLTFYVNPWFTTIVAIIIAVFLVFVVIWVVRAHQRQVSAGKEELIGKTAVVKVTLEPKGIVFLEGEHWTAVIDKGRAEPEEEVIITEVEGMKLRVTKKE